MKMNVLEYQKQWFERSAAEFCFSHLMVNYIRQEANMATLIAVGYNFDFECENHHNIFFKTEEIPPPPPQNKEGVVIADRRTVQIRTEF
jgi:hypothetical protein